MPVRIVTDSNCDLPREIVQRYNLIVVPAVINFEGRTLRDGIDISRTEYYQKLPMLKPLPTTAAGPSGEYEAAYRSCAPDPIVSIHLSAALSAIYNTARLGAEASGQKVELVDSEQASMGLGWQVLAGAEAAAAGKSVAEVVAAMASVRARMRVMALLDTVEYLRRGGRASAIQALLGEFLQIKPLVAIEQGKVASVARPRTRQKGRETLFEQVQQLGPLENLAILHANLPEEARAFADRLAPQCQNPPIVVEVTAVVGTHVGPGALGFAAVKKA